MRIGIDIDGCLSDDDRATLDDFSKYLFEHNLPEMDNPYGYEIKMKDWNSQNPYIQDYRLTVKWDYWENATAFKYANEIIAKLHDEGHEIYMITGRSLAQRQDEVGERLRTATKNFLLRNNIYYDELLFATFPKWEWFVNNSCDLVIEDFPKTIDGCKDHIPVLMFDNRYNQTYEAENVTRVFSWYDIYRKIVEKSYKGAE